MKNGSGTIVDISTASDVSGSVSGLISNIRQVISVDSIKLEYIIATKIAGGHVILADTHGVGKTSLARALAGSIDNSGKDFFETSGSSIHVDPFSRIQCTVDLLPQDIIGFTRLDGRDGKFVFNKGPIFANFVLCDEINLLTPKTQGSFFQAMEEQKVTVEGKTYDLPSPFFIIATMNLEGAHLFPLPAPQLDRFMIRISMGIPGYEEEKGIVGQHSRSDGWKNLKTVISANQLIQWQEMVDRISIHPELVDYIVTAVRATRENPYILQGASPRAGVKLSRLARSLALVRGLNYVTPDIVKELFVPSITHRITVRESAGVPSDILSEIIESIKVGK